MLPLIVTPPSLIVEYTPSAETSATVAQRNWGSKLGFASLWKNACEWGLY
jgi:hypothetical protein